VPDESIWEYAKTRGVTFITKDKDFASLSLAFGPPLKVVLLQLGNCTSAEVIRLIRDNAIRLSDFGRDANRGLLVLR